MFAAEKAIELEYCFCAKSVVIYFTLCMMLQFPC